MTIPRFLSRIVVIALAALLVSTGWPASAARGADDSNVPGIPLTGSEVTGTLGGPIYDRVYQVDVPAASVILMSLTGDVGTDFDLYLFDATATSVYLSDGLVAKSTGPTSTESISYATIGGGRFFIDLNGASDAQGTFQLVVAIESDAVAPAAAIRFNDGARATQERAVRVTLVGTDDLSGVGEMQLSVDGVTWGAFVPYTPTFLWVFDAFEGPKRLWARVRDRAGNVSATATARIDLDTTQPRVESRDPEPGGTAAGRQPLIRVRFSEAIDPATWMSQGLVVQQLDGKTVPGTYGYDEATRTGTFIPSAPLIAGQPVVCTLAGIADYAGNPLVVIGTWVVTPLQVHVIDIHATPSVVVSGGRATIRGSVDGPVYGPMTLERRTGAEWVEVTSIRPTASGSYATSVVVTQNTYFRVRAAASQVEAAGVSPVIRVVARRGITLAGVSAAGTNTARRGERVRLTAQLTPAETAIDVTATITRYDSVRRTWVPATTVRATSSKGRAIIDWRPTVTGSYRVRLTTPSTPAHANGLSALYAWTIRN